MRSYGRVGVYVFAHNVYGGVRIRTYIGVDVAARMHANIRAYRIPMRMYIISVLKIYCIFCNVMRI